MMKIIGIFLIAAVILWIEVPPLLEKKYKKELFVFSILLAIGVGLSVTFFVFEKPIPNPFDILTIIFKPLNDFISLFLK
ncbi:hypothetical protein [Lysinibacillus xylanilyticus]|uniref:Stage III sporulation protein AF n=1 Tax=Lysinibacillus xylanilyticus TaxID=582475 RepID=A0ABT4EQU8_9BACI|nr:hypothetical protein [Lysinibacillus xylanilyticus]MCY9548055.1 hypothetical protein [Lysinibacillus xylanilyticus]MED3804907.1 hypothetical protein [Lysinibacillus xylanilyticus]